VKYLDPALRSLITISFMAAALFLGAGRLDVPAAWEYLGVFGAVMIAGLFLIDPELAKERTQPGGKPPGIAMYLLTLLFLGHLCVGGMDMGRYHWSTVPESIRLEALVQFGLALGLIVWAMHVNRFFSSVVRIQSERGHALVTGGPYRWVRHPGYAAGLLFCLASGPALGSWAAEIMTLPFLPFMIYRTVTEDAFLKANLPGYREYAARVRHRLIPGVW
jgi:protein-S-isoprenylcysteine O-methyltransferase Ste14